MTLLEIMMYVGVSEIQVNMAIYSGRIPPPNVLGEWNFDDIKIYLDHWKLSVDNKRSRLVNDNYISANMVFPKHTR